jgi:hypothetical protein
VTFRFLFNSGGWDAKPLNAGMRQLIGGERKPINLGGQEATTPVPLDNDGKPLDPAAAPIFLEFKRYAATSFNGLGV